MRKLLLATAATMLATGAAFAQPAKPVAAPGTIVVHLNGYFQFGVGAYGATNMGSDAAGYKLNSVSTFGDFRHGGYRVSQRRWCRCRSGSPERPHSRSWCAAQTARRT